MGIVVLNMKKKSQFSLCRIYFTFETENCRNDRLNSNPFRIGSLQCCISIKCNSAHNTLEMKLFSFNSRILLHITDPEGTNWVV